MKANNGTYGMGIMSVKSGNEVLEINKKGRKNMSSIKEGAENSEVIIQEGIRTVDEVDGASAEPLVYLVNSKAVGCTYRVNNNKDSESNLNSVGMTFQNFNEKENSMNCPVQSLIAELASLAAARESYEINWTI